MKWDSVAQGIGLLVLSVGVYFAVNGLLFYGITDNIIQATCQVQSATLLLLTEKKEDDPTLLDSDALRIDVKFKPDNMEQHVTASIQTPIQNCGDTTQCLALLGVKAKQQIHPLFSHPF